MPTLAPWTEQWQHVTSDVREQFWVTSSYTSGRGGKTF